MPVKPMHRHAAVVTAALFCCTGAAHGALIHETVSLSTATVRAPGAGIGMYSFDLFDPALGELNSVQVDLTGFLTLTLDVALMEAGGVPLTHTVSSTLTHDIDGLAGGDFVFTPGTEVRVLHSAVSGVFQSQVSFNYSFRFDEASASLGFAAVSGGTSVFGNLGTAVTGDPAIVYGTRAAFIDTQNIGSAMYQSIWSGTYSSNYFHPLDFTYDGFMRLTYDYTPAAAVPDPVSVPEPATWLLLAPGGLASLVVRRQRRSVWR